MSFFTSCARSKAYVPVLDWWVDLEARRLLVQSPSVFQCYCTFVVHSFEIDKGHLWLLATNKFLDFGANDFVPAVFDGVSMSKVGNLQFVADGLVVLVLVPDLLICLIDD